MSRTVKKSSTIYSLLLFFPLVLSHADVYASKNEDMAHYQEKLETLQKSIKKIRQHLKGTRKQRSDILTELKNLESEISKNAITLNKLEKELDQTRQLKKALQDELSGLNKQLVAQRQILSAQIRSAYSMGRQQNIKMLLNQQNPAEVGRTQVYFDYFNRARNHEISLFLENIEKKKLAETKLKQTLSSISTLHKAQKDKTRKRQKQRTQRKKLLSELSDKIKNQENTLTSLEVSRNKIENLLESLGELLADIPTSPSEKRPFKTQKGKLPWPVSGPFIGRFGQPKNYGDLKWNGVLIKTKYGTPVRAVSHGRVAFSDWLQGFGFITIVDHGDGYMSLYGNSESLFKQAGDWVSAGDVIASAGDSGGQPQSGVYFEIRSRGKPINPEKWCSRRVKHASN